MEIKMKDKYVVDDLLSELFHLQDHDMGDLEIYLDQPRSRIKGARLEENGKFVILEEDITSKPLKYRWEMTCKVCPEQYDVYNGKRLVAYVRFRHGILTVNCPDVDGEMVFMREGQDSYPLSESCKVEVEIAISEWIKKNKKIIPAILLKIKRLKKNRDWKRILKKK